MNNMYLIIVLDLYFLKEKGLINGRLGFVKNNKSNKYIHLKLIITLKYQNIYIT